MIKLPWKKREKSKTTENHIRRIENLAENSDNFYVLVPIEVYKYLKDIEINAEIELLAINADSKNISIKTAWLQISRPE